MSAARSEEWATRALFAVMSCGVEIPEDILGAGLAGVAALGVRSLNKVPFELAKPLFDEMMGCVEFEFDAREGGARALIDDDIEEVVTRVKLRKVVLDLHIEGFLGAVQSMQATGAALIQGA
ncbi:hypothetical protein [Burkholderia cepacia]|uniref:hypothetical protein n=1 Tax=Burkholderia cepacia TaxID=292 RepID=UPI0026543FE7|nr:hypothetical protein [Burkholderia cepacia]MDN7913679.1 hypothetical protein [Burkholderia cepacia]